MKEPIVISVSGKQQNSPSSGKDAWPHSCPVSYKVENGAEVGNLAALEDGTRCCWSSEEEERAGWDFAQDWELEQSNAVDERDLGTADSWVRRHPELVRLTGRHPFNSEPPLCRLMAAGFFTPTSLHYVRNHGYVPRAEAGKKWRVEVSGLVAAPRSFTVEQIKREFKPRELPVTLVCAGNRRKEQNTVKQTVGFNWGPSALGTSVWKGAKLCHVLERVGVRSKRKGALFVCFEGAEKLPGDGGSTYGTSLAMDVAMDDANDILLAYEQNGRELEPDHGFPIRMIIPGYIGGRMVKWLTRIWVTSEESSNYYHFRDNRVLPSHVDAKKADAEGWWRKPGYVINELNVNSVITTPAHAQVVPVNASTVETFVCKGYAYSGGGRKVIRVEGSLDGGGRWRPCQLTHPEKPTKYGKHYCWCFWDLELDTTELLSAKELVVRAWDQAMNTQPQELTWNVMGMMNNCWFRVKVHTCRLKDGGINLTFEHPVKPGNHTGGWMMRQKDQIYDVPAIKPTSLSPCQRHIPMSEVMNHTSQDSAWIVVKNKVYDCTRFLESHHGGKDSILINAGTDCTDEFFAIHSAKAKDMLEEFYIGELAEREAGLESAIPDTSVQSPVNSCALQLKQVAALDPKRKTAFQLVGKENLSQNLIRLRFALQSPHHVLGLPCGNHVILRARVNGKLVMRAYTPISSSDQLGFFDLVVKVYLRSQHPKFPKGGIMSQHLDKMQVGATICVSGPLGKIHYLGRGHLSVGDKVRQAGDISMVAGGTGITPLYQIIQAIVDDSQDTTQVSLIYANHREEDIIQRDQLDKWRRTCKNVRIWYTVTDAPTTWQYSTGCLTESMMRQHLFPPGPATVALLCGPPAMCQLCCIPNLLSMDYDRDSCFIF